MQTDKLNRWFESFRSSGDVKALGRVFDAAAPSLTGLARHMSRDVNEADDLVQATFLTAIEKAKKFDGSRPLLPWLLGILTFHARESRRRKSRNVDPERVRSGLRSDPLLEAREAELDQALEDALKKLPEIHEQILRAHLVQGLRPEQIATQFHIAPGTARVRLHRALKRLRGALPPSFATGFFALFIPDRSQAGMRLEVLRHAARNQGVPWSAALARPTRTGLSTGLAIVGGGATLGALALVLRVEPEPVASLDPSALALERGPQSAEQGRQPLALGRKPDTMSASATDGRAAAEAELGWWLVGQLEVLAEDSAPDLELARVFVEDLASRQAPLEVHADAHGRFEQRIDSWVAQSLGRPDEVAVRVQHPEFAPAGCIVSLPRERPFDVHTRHEIPCRLGLEPSVCAIVGTVSWPGQVPADSQPLEVAVFRSTWATGGKLKDGLSKARVDASGAFSVSLDAPGEYVVASVTRDLAPAWVRLSVEQGKTARVALELRDTLALAGRVRLAHERSVGGATLVARAVLPPGSERLRLNGGALAWTGKTLLPLVRSATIAGDGSFELRGLAPGPCRVICSLEPWLAARGIERGAQDSSAGLHELVVPSVGLDLEFDLRIRTLEVRADGLALAGAHIEPLSGAWSKFSSKPTAEEWRRAATINQRTDRSGRYALVAERLEGLAVRIDEPGHRSVRVVLGPDPTPQDALSVEVVEVQGDSYSGDVEIVLEGYGEHGPELFRVKGGPLVADSRERAGEGIARRPELTGGSLYLDRLAPGTYELSVRPLEGGDRGWFGSYLCPFSLEVQVHPGSLTRAVVQAQVGGRLRLIDVAPDEPLVRIEHRASGLPVEVRFFAVDAATSRRQMLNKPRHGRLNQTWPNLPPGDYTVLIGTGADEIEKRVTLKPGETTVLSCAAR